MELVKVVKKSGHGAHVSVPKAWRGREVSVLLDENNPLMRKKDVVKLVENMIEDAGGGN